MTQQTKHALNGFLIIDKPLTYTCNDVSRIVKKALRPQKIGHVGTLDPLACGVLVFALGHATKIIPYWRKQEKVYEFHITFGEQRTTDDAQGDCIATSNFIPTIDLVQQITHEFTGILQQTPPRYSAVHVNGKRAYALAREGCDFTLTPKNVEIKKLRVLEKISDKTIALEVTCGPGTYVRSLAVDLAKHLGTVGFVSFLKRTYDAPFSLEHTISLENLSRISHNDVSLFSMSFVLDDIPAVTISKKEHLKVLQGQSLLLHDMELEPTIHADAPCVRLERDNVLIAMAMIEQGFVKPKRLISIGEIDVDNS